MKTYKIGDCVIIKKNLNTRMDNVTSEMVKYAGKIAIITTIVDVYCGVQHYELKFDKISQDWAWGTNMFDLGEREIKQFGIVNFCNTYYKWEKI